MGMMVRMDGATTFYSLEKRYQILKSIAQAEDLDSLLALLGEEIGKLSLVDGYLINLCGPSGDELVSMKISFPTAYRYLDKTYYGYKLPINSESINQNVRAFLSRHIVRAHETEGFDSDKPTLTRWNLDEFSSMPMLDPDLHDAPPLGTLGLMKVEGLIPEQAFDTFNELISLFFTPLKTALSTSFLKDFQQHFKAAADEQSRALEFIIELNNLTATEKVLDMFSVELFRRIPFECIGFFLQEENGLKNKMVACSDAQFNPIKDEWSDYLADKWYELSNVDGGVSHAFMKNSSLMFQDVQLLLHMPMSEKDVQTLRILKTPRTLLVLPIRYQKEPIGAIAFFSLSKIVELSETDLRMLDSLSSFLGTAIVNSANFALSKQQNVELERLASHDGLTGLPNRALLMDRLRRGLSRWARHHQKATIAFVDLDHFKSINDSLGHAAGDKTLVTAANKLVKAIRQSDTVARFGGDEFVLILEDRGSNDSHMQVLNRIAASLSEPMDDLPLEIAMTCSIGFSRYPEDGEDADTLLNAADSAMYLAKQLGRSNIQPYTADMRIQALERLTMENKLRHAAESNQLLLYYQPKVDLRTGRVVGMEALVRWHHPELGMVMPGVFIPLAEETGLIVAIGDWILRAACAQALAWKQAGTPVPIAVNLSARQFQQPDISLRVRDALESIGLDAQYLELELTESMSMGNPERSIAVMQSFKELGITLTIDDFGTGYSNLSYLKRFPVDKLKLDQSFVRDITQSAEALAISQAVLAVAHNLGLKVVAEGVETEAQLNLLGRNHCDEVQGYYFSRPIPAEQCTAFLDPDRRMNTGEMPQITNKRTILIVDDDRNIVDMLEMILSLSGYIILKAESGAAALELLAVNSGIAVVLSDNMMPGMNGLDLLNNVKHMYPEIVRVMLSGCSEEKFLVDAINRNLVFRFIPKPWEVESLKTVIIECCNEYERLASLRTHTASPAVSRRSK
jgi:diguanylate cyclase (GGDEF)-like protein